MITLNSTDFTTYLNRAVCFFHMFDRLFFIIMNRLHCICVHSIKKLSLLFCKIRQKNRMHLSAVCFNFAQHNNEQTLHTLKTLGSKQPN